MRETIDVSASDAQRLVSLMVDLRYAQQQIRIATRMPSLNATRDCCQRALDALERIADTLEAEPRR